MKTVNIKGKEYVEVNERLKYFREHYPEYTLISEILSMGDGMVVMKATIISPENRVIATGHAYEMEDSSFINKTSYIENCETSAWGRALANFGIELDTSVASAEEVQNAVLNQPINKSTQRQASTTRTIQNTNTEEISGHTEDFRVCECGNAVYPKISKRTGKDYYKCDNCGEWVNE
jgi:hypothetical protein